ncbi:undecaprenyl-diphosphate phosphatase, partial [bacterium]|nr:undecaprenyl-diphosphate phosphatase [bacterium]
AMKCRSALGAGDVWAMAFAGLLVSAAVGYVALRLFLKVVEKGKLWVFSAYCFVLGAAVIVYELVA